MAHRAPWRQEIDDAAQIAKQRTPAQPINLKAYVQSAFDGTNDEVNIGAAPTQDAAIEAVRDAVIARYGRALSYSEYIAVQLEVGMQWNARIETRRAQLSDTQRALHSGRRVFA